jgi:hypothetical protein
LIVEIDHDIANLKGEVFSPSRMVCSSLVSVRDWPLIEWLSRSVPDFEFKSSMMIVDCARDASLDSQLNPIQHIGMLCTHLFLPELCSDEHQLKDGVVKLFCFVSRLFLPNM